MVIEIQDQQTGEHPGVPSQQGYRIERSHDFFQELISMARSHSVA